MTDHRVRNFTVRRGNSSDSSDSSVNGVNGVNGKVNQGHESVNGRKTLTDMLVSLLRMT